MSYQKQHQEFKWSLSFENVFDNDVQNPDHSTGGQNGVPYRVSSIPWGAGRGVFVGLEWRI